MSSSDQSKFAFYRGPGRIYTVGDRTTRYKVTRFRKRFPGIFRSIEPALYLLGQERGFRALEIALDDITRKLIRPDLKLTLDDHQLVEFCRIKAKACGKIRIRLGYNERALVSRLGNSLTY